MAFGPDVTANFLKTNGLKMVVRSHEMKERGYEVRGRSCQSAAALMTFWHL